MAAAQRPDTPARPLPCLPGLPADSDPTSVITEMVRRACGAGFDRWWQLAQSVGFCAAPIQLAGTDEVGRRRLVWARCNNRRASVCPSCSDLYARDTWQLVAAGTTGGRHQVPADVATRPQVFATLTAPSFGTVHHHTGTRCRTPGSNRAQRCGHGNNLSCSVIHDSDDPLVGQPICAQCYNYLGHVLFTWHLPELWRRFTIALRRALAAHLKTIGADSTSLRLSFVKVTEMQARAIPHIHTLIRLDPTNDDGRGAQDKKGPAAPNSGGHQRPDTPPRWKSPVTANTLAALIQQAARSVSLDVLNPASDPGSSGELDTVPVRFGRQIDTQPIAAETGTAPTDSAGSLAMPVASPRRVAGYLAKYVTKSLADFGISARRLSAEAIPELNVTSHVRAILTTIDTLASHAHRTGPETLAAIGRWLHTLGFRGHITTKSRHYSTTLTHLRAIRADWTRQHPGTQHAIDTVPQANPRDLVSNDDDDDRGPMWQFDKPGVATAGDRTLIIAAALRHIEARRTGLAERQASRTATAPGDPDG